VPCAEALTTALGTSAREALVTLARALAEEVQATDDTDARHKAVRIYLSVVKQIDAMDNAAVREARALARAEAAIDWMARRDEERAKAVAMRVAEKMARQEPKAGPASSVIDELKVARDKRVRRRPA